jgi:hypothetical protein
MSLFSPIANAGEHGIDVQLNRERPKLNSGIRFRQQIRKMRMTASWSRVSLRHVLKRISDQGQVAILLDRRVDPSQEIAIEVQDKSLVEAIRAVARKQNADVCVLNSAFYVGPAVDAAKLRTLIHLRSNELFQLSKRLPRGRYFDLTRRKALHWNDLDRPVDVLNQISVLFKIKDVDHKVVPHDLWAGATLPRVNAVESLSLFAIQYGLTFRWRADTSGVEWVNIPDRVVIEKSYPRGLHSMQSWKKRWPDLKMEVNGSKVIVRATVEQHEQIAALRNGSRKTPKSSAKPPTPVLDRLFTLKLDKVPAIELMKKLESTGIQFQFDQKQLASNGVNLKTPISMNVEQANAVDFFNLMFGQLNAQAKLKGITVWIRPKE